MLGVVVMIFRYQWELNEVFQDLSVNYSEIVRMDADIQSIQPILDDIKKLTRLLKVTEINQHWHTIEITDLYFYNICETVQQQQVFNKVEFKIRRGEKTALIGLSGSGKSTLLNLLAGLYTPSKVKLKVDEVYFNSLEPLKSIIILIPQDPEIFKNTIKFNITMNLPIELEQINYIVKLSGFSDVLASLPYGLETDVSEKGLHLSVGQKQCLALARGLLAVRSSSLILMDEPTSSVALATEKAIFF